jgi:hypothetical protein
MKLGGSIVGIDFSKVFVVLSFFFPNKKRTIWFLISLAICRLCECLTNVDV